MLQLSAEPIRLLYEVHVEALFGKILRSHHSRQAASSHQCGVYDRLGLLRQRNEAPGLCHRRGHQVLRLLTRLSRLRAVHPCTLVANVGHLEQVLVKPGLHERLLEDRRVRSVGARRHDDTVEILPADGIADGSQPVW